MNLIRNPMKKSLLIASMSVLAGNAFALTAFDDASNYGGGWADGSSLGSGFGTWSLTSDGSTGGFAGYFIGDSTAGAGDINTGSSQSFAMYANGAADSSVAATRSFSTALTTDDQFSFDFAVNFADGNRGFNLRTSGTNVIGLNIGSTTNINTGFTDNSTNAQTYDYGGGDAMLQAVIQVIGLDRVDYQISRISSQGVQGVLFAGSITDIVGSIDNFEFYISGDDSSSGNGDNLYFNSLSVSEVPEPGTYALIAGTLALLCVAKRRRG